MSKSSNKDYSAGIVILVVLGILLLAATGFLINAAIILVVWHALAGFFHFQTITYGIAMLIEAGLITLGGFFRSVSNSG